MRGHSRSDLDGSCAFDGDVVAEGDRLVGAADVVLAREEPRHGDVVASQVAFKVFNEKKSHPYRM